MFSIVVFGGEAAKMNVFDKTFRFLAAKIEKGVVRCD